MFYERMQRKKRAALAALKPFKNAASKAISHSLRRPKTIPKMLR